MKGWQRFLDKKYYQDKGKYTKIGLTFGLLWGIVASLLLFSANPEYNHEIEQIEIFNGNIIILLILAIPTYLGAWVLLFIIPLEKVVSTFPRWVDIILYFVVVLSIIFSTSIVFGFIGSLIDRFQTRS